jgi:2-keto-4-pentenoate hydratase/2-oxohepta-3-ene-1,7-dioic acid hydratase in catechol pathway
MKICTFQRENENRVGVLVDETTIADINIAYASYLYDRVGTRAYKIADVLTPPNMIGTIEGGIISLNAIKETMETFKSKPDMKGPKGEKIFYSLKEVKLMAPVPHPPKILAPALNHRQGWDNLIRPDTEPHPVYFIKLPTCVTGPYDSVEIPDVGVVGSEVEIGAIIGKKGKNIPIEKAEEYIFGYTVHNDITAHELRDTEEWIIVPKPDGGEMRLTYAGRYKCFDTFAPMGPWIVTRDEITDIHNCKMEARVNDQAVQQGTSADMVFKFPQLVSYFSSAHTLEPGDVISSGTCIAAPGWNIISIDLRKLGGVLESEIEGIGIMKNPIQPI